MNELEIILDGVIYIFESDEALEAFTERGELTFLRSRAATQAEIDAAEADVDAAN